MTHHLRLGALEIRFNWLIALCVVLALGLFINLGLWQLERAAQKGQMQAEFAASQQAEPTALEDLLETYSSGKALLSDMANRRVLLQGEYLADRSFLILFQYFQGRPGYEVISSFRLGSDGSLVLVSRGWLAPATTPDGVPEVPQLEGEQTLTGQLHVLDAATVSSDLETQQWPLVVRRLHLPQLEDQLGEVLPPLVVRLEPGAPGVLTRHWPAVTISTSSNIGYAMQWFGFALLTLVASVLMSSNLLQLWRQRRSH